MKATKLRASEQKTLAGFGKRIDDQKQLAEVYAKWTDLVAAKQRTVVHRMLTGLAIILGILLVGIFFDSWLERLLGKTSLDRRQVETMRTVTRVAVQICAVLLILLVILGPPSQLGTILGLAGAGLTVALKDFIVGFLGWFVLMGKNGIRLGDWVEINGVTGEVVERSVDSDGDHVAHIRTAARNQRGETVMPGSAVLALPTRDGSESPAARRARR